MLQSMGLQRIRHDLGTEQQLLPFLVIWIFEFILLGVYKYSYTCGLMSLNDLGKLFASTSSNIASALFSLSSSLELQSHIY